MAHYLSKTSLAGSSETISFHLSSLQFVLKRKAKLRLLYVAAAVVKRTSYFFSFY